MTSQQFTTRRNSMLPTYFAAILLIFLWNLSIIPYAFTQSNYASHANNIGYQGEGLPEEATLDGKVNFSFLFCYLYYNCIMVLS